MRRLILITILAALMVCVFSGCGFWMDGERLSVTPHMEQSQLDVVEVTEVSNYMQLRKSLIELIESGASGGIMSVSSFNKVTASFYVDTAINHVLGNTAIGAYAVDSITYEVGTNRGASVIAFKIAYEHTISEIQRMRYVPGMDEAVEVIAGALDNCDHSVSVRVQKYEEIDFVQFVQDYANNHPDTVMEVPNITASVYPDNGADRIIEVSFTYQTSRETLRRMQEQVAPVFTSAELYVTETTQVRDIYARLYAFLMERNAYKLESSITPAYSLLHHGVGDSRAFANVYAAMCRQVDLYCQVVSGTRDGEPWCWNVIRYRGKYYHVDLHQCSQTGGFRMREHSEMEGYVWDYSAFIED